MSASLPINSSVFGSLLALIFARGWRWSKDVSLGKVIAECIDAKRFANLRPVYVLELERYLGKFRLYFGERDIDSLKPAEIEQWLNRPEWAAATRATGINRLSALFSFALRKGYVDANPIDRIERVRLDYKPPRILSPDDAEKLLAMAVLFSPDMLGHVILGMFAGIRPGELSKLSFGDVDIEQRIIRIDAATSKVRRRRFVELEPKAIHWLKLHVICEGPVTPRQKRRKLRRLAAAMGWDCWPKDVLRHTAASYLMAKYRDAGLVADKLGNSPSILLRHYRELVSADDAAKFWAIRP